MPRRQSGQQPVLQPGRSSGETRTEQSRAEVRQYRQPQMVQTRPVRAMTAAERKKDEERKKKKKDLKIAKKR